MRSPNSVSVKAIPPSRLTILVGRGGAHEATLESTCSETSIK
jgi:hypothetical protein